MTVELVADMIAVKRTKARISQDTDFKKKIIMKTTTNKKIGIRTRRRPHHLEYQMQG
jgi:hypothetical protein